MTTEQIIDALRIVQEPDLGSDIISLNMVKDVVDKEQRCFIYTCAYHPCLST